MAVDDLWYSSRRERGPDGKLLPAAPTKRHGRGKRWRVRWTDPETDQTRTESFDRKPDAERHDAAVRADIARGLYVDPAAGRTTVKDYADDWRAQLLHRPATAANFEWVFRMHVLPALGHLPIASVRPGHIRSLVKDRGEHLSPATVHMVIGYLGTMFRAAVADRVIGTSPVVGIKLPPIDRDDRFIPSPAQVHALADALPSRFRAAVYIAAGCGLRPAEVLGLEAGDVDFLRRSITVRRQLQYQPGRGVYLAPVKTKTSARTVELPGIASVALARQLAGHPVASSEIEDASDPRRARRRDAELLFTLDGGGMLHRAAWSRVWRPAVAAVEDVPVGFGLHGCRHYFATLLIHAGASVKTVQLALGHSTPTVTLATYVHEWPDAVDRTRTLVDAALGEGTRAALAVRR